MALDLWFAAFYDGGASALTIIIILPTRDDLFAKKYLLLTLNDFVDSVISSVIIAPMIYTVWCCDKIVQDWRFLPR